MVGLAAALLLVRLCLHGASAAVVSRTRRTRDRTLGSVSIVCIRSTKIWRGHCCYSDWPAPEGAAGENMALRGVFVGSGSDGMNEADVAAEIIKLSGSEQPRVLSLTRTRVAEHRHDEPMALTQHHADTMELGVRGGAGVAADAGERREERAELIGVKERPRRVRAHRAVDHQLAAAREEQRRVRHWRWPL